MNNDIERLDVLIEKLNKQIDIQENLLNRLDIIIPKSTQFWTEEELEIYSSNSYAQKKQEFIQSQITEHRKHLLLLTEERLIQLRIMSREQTHYSSTLI